MIQKNIKVLFIGLFVSIYAGAAEPSKPNTATPGGSSAGAPVPPAPTSANAPPGNIVPGANPNGAAGVAPAAAAPSGGEKKPKKLPEPKKEKSVIKIPAEIKNLIVEDVQPGTGKIAVKGKSVKVNYTGWFFDAKQPQMKGFQLDTSVGKEPFEFTLGEKQVIAGWDQGLINMKVGGKRKLYIPPDLAYGTRGTRDGVVPVNQALLFEVELLDVMDEKTVIK